MFILYIQQFPPHEQAQAAKVVGRWQLAQEFGIRILLDAIFWKNTYAA